jgi:hypothetical protein
LVAIGALVALGTGAWWFQRGGPSGEARPVAAASALRPGRQPHDAPQLGELTTAPASLQADCASERYGFLGDYLGLAVDRGSAWAAWADLREQLAAPDVCAGHTCQGNRNIGVHVARVPR